ncbi:MAG: sensor histidine kinase [Candidatus Omnitrophota bacterium]
MKLRIVFIFLVSVLIPTGLLAYFGLLAVRSEKQIVESHSRARYEAMADIVIGEIRAALIDAPEALSDRQAIEAIVRDQKSIFRGQVAICDEQGLLVSGEVPSGSGGPVYSRRLKDIPFRSFSSNVLEQWTLKVYDRYPLLGKRTEERKRRPYFYVGLIVFSALSIIAGGVFTLGCLSRQWRLAELKNEFVTRLSHDLRRPLTSIRMFSEMLRDGRVPDEDKRREYYGIISGESERLTQLANNILGFSRIEQGRNRDNFRSEDIVALVRDTVAHFREYEASHRINLRVHGVFPRVKMDAESLSQALINLLSNAVKYSPPDKDIDVNLVRGDNNAVIEVVDRGMGVLASEKKKIFRRFYRSRRAPVGKIEGSGLGLVLVKYAAEAHNGRVVLESEEGRGSKFSLILPI